MMVRMDDERLIGFFQEINKLKRIKRSGWVVDKVKNPESVAEHSFRTAVMCMFLGKGRRLDLEKAMKMALIHDIAEARIGDIISYWRYPKAVPVREKAEKEQKAMAAMASGLEGGRGLLELWKEYEARKTKEAMFVKQVEKLEMALQALEYEKEGYGIRGHYFQEADELIKDPGLRRLLRKITDRRP